MSTGTGSKKDRVVVVFVWYHLGVPLLNCRMGELPRAAGNTLGTCYIMWGYGNDVMELVVLVLFFVAARAVTSN